MDRIPPHLDEDKPFEQKLSVACLSVAFSSQIPYPALPDSWRMVVGLFAMSERQIHLIKRQETLHSEQLSQQG